MSIAFNEKYKYYEAFFYVTINNKRKQIHKRGFKTKREAKLYEQEYIKKYNNSTLMSFQSAYELYLEDCKKRVKPSTIASKQVAFIPALDFFKNALLEKITPLDIRNYQNFILSKGYAKTTQKIYTKQISSLFNFFIKYYGLKQNPCIIAGSIGSSKTQKEMQVWSVQEFQKFIENIKNQYYKLVFSLLFWSGMRIGELQALTIGDFDFEKNTININKTYYKIKKKEYISTPKTEQSKRVIDMPKNIMEMAKDYIEHFPVKNKACRLFLYEKVNYKSLLENTVKKIGLKKIRIHDLRHSHASLLLNEGVNIIAVSKRLGHSNIAMTLKTYTHLLEQNKKELIEKLNYITKITPQNK